MEENELYHYGVEGMKWGVRRYQNEDGSLTALGREHYGLKNLSTVNKDFHSDTGNKRAVREKDRHFREINRVEARDKKELLEEADRKYGEGYNVQKQRWIEKEMVKIAEAAQEAKYEVEIYLNTKFGEYSMSSVVRDDLKRQSEEAKRRIEKQEKEFQAAVDEGKRAVAKSERQTNRIVIGGLALAGALGLAYWSKQRKGKKGGGPVIKAGGK